MFYKIRNLLIMVLSFAFVGATFSAKAQGLVSLSEEAMFDDELENNDLPSSASETENIEAPSTVSLGDNGGAKLPVIGATLGASENAMKSENNNPQASMTLKEEIPSDPIMPKEQPKPTDLLPAAPKNTDSKANSETYTFTPNSDITTSLNTDLFEEMSDIEKRSALLNLQLKREKLENEIEAVKSQRRKALAEEQEKAEQERLKKIEREKELERLAIEEQEKLRALDIQFETLRQEAVLNAYKDSMLEKTQEWIGNNAQFYKQIDDLRKSRKAIIDEMNSKMNTLQKQAQYAKEAHTAKINSYKKEAEEMQSQLSVLRRRIEVMEREREEAKKNPFATPEVQARIAMLEKAAGKTGASAVATNETAEAGGVSTEPTKTDLSRLYGVKEIRGQNDELIAKLINKSGTSFYVKRGTLLQSGHAVKDITPTYVLTEKDGNEAYLYFSAGGLLPRETENKFELEKGGDGDGTKNKDDKS